jgi:Secretion system C-terminal sorting domain/Fascin domain
MKLKKLLLLAIAIFSFSISNFAQGNFNKATDLLLANYDIKADEDDIHSVTAFACMLNHPDLAGIKYFVVAGAYGTQPCNFVTTAVPGLYNLFFGPENTNWTNANANRAASVTRVKDKMKATIDAGGRVFIAEAGQSDVTYDAIQQVIGAGISVATIKARVILVQHSQFNETFTTQSKLTWLKANTTYTKIADGNTGGNGTPGYNDGNQTWLNQSNGTTNTNATTKNFWSQCDFICDTWNTPGTNCFSNSVINGGGVDFSDTVEIWWIFNVGANADNVAKFWARYVTNGTVVTPPTGGTSPIGKAISMQNGGRFVSSENGTTSMTCNRTSVGAWERFTVVAQANNKVALKGTNGRFVSCENGTIPITCNRTTAGTQELFDLVNVTGTTFQLRGSNGRFVSSEVGAGFVMTCNRTAAGAWETFNWAQNGAAFRVAETESAEVPTADFSFYPNPAKTSITVDLPKNSAKINIFDVKGKLVKAVDANGETKVEVDLKMNSGLYFLNVDKSKAKKLIVNN